MSYVRFHWGDSDLYGFGTDQGIECCGCRLVGRDGPWSYTDPAEFIRHLYEHEAAGHVVMPGLARDVWEDWRDADTVEDTWARDVLEPFDPTFPEPPEPGHQARADWQREVRRDLGILLPFIGRPDFERDGTPADEWLKR